MEAVDDTARAHLRRLRSMDPPWTYSQSAQALGMSRGWVKQGKPRLQEAEAQDE
jgi:hypothetical protein